MKKVFRWIPLVAAMALAGCMNLAPDYVRPEAPVAQVWPEGEAYASTELRRGALAPWTDIVKDDRLRRVIELGLANNRDLRVAALNVEKARAQYGIQRSELFPSISAGAENAGSRTPATLSALGRHTTQHQYSAQLAMASYELDFFGRVRNLNEQALQAYLASDDARLTVRNTLIAEIAMTWLQLGADTRQLQLQRETLTSQEKTFSLITESWRLGAASQLDYEQARTTVAAARAAIESYVRAVAQDRNALELLVGARLDDGLLPEGLEQKAVVSPSMPEGIPSEVLLNRPDIRQAERDLIGANAYIGAARAAFFPRITLTGAVGSAGTELGQLFDSGSGLWSFTPNVSIPIFSGGLNLSNLEVAEAAQKIAVASYEKAIQTAFRETADALATEGTVEKELRAREEYADAALKAYRLSEDRYELGVASYTEVLDAQRASVAAEQQLISAQLARTASFVTLYKVLGGGALEVPEEASAGVEE